MRFDVLTLFPGIFEGYVSQSLLKKGIDAGLVAVHLHDVRKWSGDKHNRVDDRPYGGGPGMVMRVGPVVECYEDVVKMDERPAHPILLSPQGTPLNQRRIEQLAAMPRLVMLCGRYEGFDQRVIDILQPEEVSIGDYILNGGEVAAMAVIDAVIRLVPGVLGDEESSQLDSFSSGNRLLEGGQYTRPRDYRGHTVPDILLSGNHEQIDRWRKEQSYEKTKLRRADLLTRPSPEDIRSPK